MAVTIVGANTWTFNGASVPSNPSVGDTWQERDGNNSIIDNWLWDGSNWLSLQLYTVSLPAGYRTTSFGQVITTFPHTKKLPSDFVNNSVLRYIYLVDAIAQNGASSPLDANNDWSVAIFMGDYSYIFSCFATQLTGNGLIRMSAFPPGVYPLSWNGQLRLDGTKIGSPGAFSSTITFLYRMVR